MRSEGIKCLEPEHKADFSGLNFFWKSCENTAQLESKTSNWGESEVPVLHLTTDRHFSVQNKGFSDQPGKLLLEGALTSWTTCVVQYLALSRVLVRCLVPTMFEHLNKANLTAVDLLT